ncbi:MAG: N-acetyltransferase [Deltaproteobacteria bacterium]|nr:MAG: N-acetyltransferase [Deltaproteobacteria bacterium]
MAGLFRLACCDITDSVCGRDSTRLHRHFRQLPRPRGQRHTLPTVVCDRRGLAIKATSTQAMIPSSSKLLFRPVTQSDLPMILAWRNSDHVRLHMPHQEWITPERHERWFQSVVQSEQHHYWLFGPLGSEAPIGLAHLKNHSPKDRCAESGLYIADPGWRQQGWGLAAYQDVLSFGFQELSLLWVYAHILQTNVVSLAFHSKLGFQTDGPLLQKMKTPEPPPQALRMVLLRAQLHQIKPQEKME